jgi:hypothetical protein
MNVEAGPAESVSAVGSTPNLIQRVILVFTSPGKLGEAMRTASPWFWTLAIVAIISAILLILVPADVFRQTMEAQAAGRQQAQGQPDPETMLMIARYGGAAAALLVTFIGAFVAAGALYLAFNVMFGQDTTYKQHLSAYAHVAWISLLGFIVVLPIWISKGDMTTQLGFGLLLADAPSSFVGHLMNSIKLFGLWGSVALGAVEAGLSGGRITLGKGIGVVLGLYFVLALFSAAFPTLFGG